jgi:hypothetical protein
VKIHTNFINFHKILLKFTNTHGFSTHKIFWWILHDYFFECTRKQIQKETTNDATLWQIYHKLQRGTPDELQSKYSLHDDGVRVVISKTLQGLVLKKLYNTHLGMMKMKALARSHCFDTEFITTSTRRWRNVEVAVLFNVRQLTLRSTHGNFRQAHGNEYIHIDYAGSFMDMNFFDYCWLGWVFLQFCRNWSHLTLKKLWWDVKSISAYLIFFCF